MKSLSKSVLLLVLVLFASPTLGDRPCTWCLEKFQVINHTPWRDAQCCDPNYYWDCPNYLNLGYNIVERYTGCGIAMVTNGYSCNGDNNCADYWGEGGDSCVIPSGGVCPAECERCTMQY